jgi:hypothetical protein
LSNAFQRAPEGLPTRSSIWFVGSPTRDWVAYVNEIFDAGYMEMMKPSLAYATLPATPAPALPASAYLGDYRNDYVGDAKITESVTLYLHPGRRAGASR